MSDCFLEFLPEVKDFNSLSLAIESEDSSGSLVPVLSHWVLNGRLSYY